MHAKLFELIHNNKLYSYSIILWVFIFTAMKMYMHMGNLDIYAILYLNSSDTDSIVYNDVDDYPVFDSDYSNLVDSESITELRTKDFLRQQDELPEGAGSYQPTKSEADKVLKTYLAPENKAPYLGNPSQIDPPGLRCEHINRLCNLPQDKAVFCWNTVTKEGHLYVAHHKFDVSGVICVSCKQQYCQQCLYESVQANGQPLLPGITGSEHYTYPIPGWDIPVSDTKE